MHFINQKDVLIICDEIDSEETTQIFQFLYEVF
jgi:HrpA-like RNA helicase